VAEREQPERDEQQRQKEEVAAAQNQDDDRDRYADCQSPHRLHNETPVDLVAGWIRLDDAWRRYAVRARRLTNCPVQ
jgi:hypothetical protein